MQVRRGCRQELQVVKGQHRDRHARGSDDVGVTLTAVKHRHLAQRFARSELHLSPDSARRMRNCVTLDGYTPTRQSKVAQVASTNLLAIRQRNDTFTVEHNSEERCDLALADDGLVGVNATFETKKMCMHFLCASCCALWRPSVIIYHNDRIRSHPR
jgi:hypothetical protein